MLALKNRFSCRASGDRNSLRTNSSSLDFLKDAYQLHEDDRVHFKVPFDPQGYGPDDIKVSTSDNGVIEHAENNPTNWCSQTDCLKDDKTGGGKLHVKIPADPEITAEDLCIRMDANRAVVSGESKTVDKTDNSSSTLIKEFSRSYDVPRTVDTLSFNAQLKK
ncbi:hypothetical protein X801_08181, partial [Opisthorchis viverrini]